MKSTNDGRRKSRIEKEVQGAISKFIINQMKSDVPGLVTVTRVQMPADFRGAQVFVTYFDINSNSELQKNKKTFDIVQTLQSWASEIQEEITSELKLRYCPKIKFFYDEALTEALKIETILSSLSSSKNQIQKTTTEETD